MHRVRVQGLVMCHRRFHHSPIQGRVVPRSPAIGRQELHTGVVVALMEVVILLLLPEHQLEWQDTVITLCISLAFLATSFFFLSASVTGTVCTISCILSVLLSIFPSPCLSLLGFGVAFFPSDFFLSLLLILSSIYYRGH